MRILMMPHKNYHAQTMYNIAKELNALGIETAFLQPVEKYRNEGVYEVAKENGFTLIENQALCNGMIHPEAVLVMNDWDMASRHLLDYCHENGIQVIGLQEGICDFHRINWNNPSYQDKNRLPYSYCDSVMLCSEFDASHFPNTPYRLVGMERVEPLFEYDVAFPQKPVVLVNLNFSYNVCVEFSRQWLEDVVQACETCGFEYVISRHPQDQTDVKGFEHKISDLPLHALIMESTVFISRFSNAIYESLIMGKPVVYYNFHQEKSRYFNETMDVFSAVYRKEDLAEAVLFESKRQDVRKAAKDFLEYRLSIDPHKSSAKRAAENIDKFLSSWRENRKKKGILVSLIVPVYNTEAYLKECLDSILAQTMKEIEIICINDASLDQSEAILREYQKTDDRFQIVSLDNNKGQGNARNIGLDYASGNAILFVDSDDWIEPTLCEDAYQRLLLDQSDLVEFQYYHMFPDRQLLSVNFKNDGFIEDVPSKQALLRTCGPPLRMYSASFLHKYNIRFPAGVIYEDWYWSLQWAAHAKRISLLKKPLYYYRREREGSTTTACNYQTMVNNIIHNLHLCSDFIHRNDYSMTYLYFFIHKMMTILNRDLSESEREDISKTIRTYLLKEFPDGLPQELNTKSIKSLYVAEPAVNDLPISEAAGIRVDEEYGQFKTHESFKSRVKRVLPKRLWTILSICKQFVQQGYQYAKRVLQKAFK